MPDSKTFGATTLLAGLLAALGEAYPEGVGADDFEQLDHGVKTTLHLPTGDRYEVAVRWLGDREA